jgi:hypothetical protein
MRTYNGRVSTEVGMGIICLDDDTRLMIRNEFLARDFRLYAETDLIGSVDDDPLVGTWIPSRFLNPEEGR